MEDTIVCHHCGGPVCETPYRPVRVVHGFSTSKVIIRCQRQECGAGAILTKVVRPRLFFRKTLYLVHLPEGKMAFTCPHCEQVSYTRTSRYLSNLTQEEYFQCSNLTCGHTFTTYRYVRETLCPPALPKAGVSIPMATKQRLSELQHELRRKKLENQLELPGLTA
ncbi:ogr/Delta-like zinc finger family protein [Chromobacterium sphagni]|uniref:ogr/Delta-like zinc finger family protein n=1 Tax=Chromobacterium sphagni TaxID=1903179 RepID=UPI0009F5CD83|nr:ogr/Delta-like zinc finger family protein [Chromobacterium sphagni]